MFDANTTNLVASAPIIDGLDLSTLPQRLTEAYASVVAARIRIREGGSGPDFGSEVGSLLGQMRRLAFTYEAYVSCLPDKENRGAAAFVAGSAHHVCRLAETIGVEGAAESSLGISGISSDVSATLLFLSAEASADASEMAKLINGTSVGVVESALLVAIRHLANGHLESLLDEPVPNPSEFLDVEPTTQAVTALYFMILEGVRSLAASVLEPWGEGPWQLNEPDPLAMFARVKNLCVDTIPDVIEPKGPLLSDIFSGPFHLASLLYVVSQDLFKTALMSVPAPPDVDPDQWKSCIRGMARKRPYLWRNHREAIASGYLKPGVSSVISFPTGAGKSTLAELKIAAAILREQKVIFLAPTLALVDQTAKALAMAFPDTELKREQGEGILFDFEIDTLPMISVMTPERCLALLGFNPEAFGKVGLFVFDECHLLHPRNVDRSRRSIDAMLCLLNFVNLVPTADLVLLSAMVKNSKELSSWIKNLTNRECIALSLTWKPTRQVRGCVVYQSNEIRNLNIIMNRVKRSGKTKNPPAALRRILNVRPYGLFCLRQTWISNDRQDYALLPILSDPVLLAAGSAGGRWYLTPNGNSVAASLAQATAAKGMKTLVFTQTIPWTTSATASIGELLGAANIHMSREEQRCYEMSVKEFGNKKYLYVDVSDDKLVLSSCVCHHGLLLPTERQLHESLYKRKDGINAMVATSTLAQGMNLPSEVVIIAGDSRFDPDADQMERLEAHELLNAAGRAGRAGERSHGFVLIIPSKVVDFDDSTGRIHGYWADLQAIFAQSDQCIEIGDPFEVLLDKIHTDADNPGEIASYFIGRLPVGNGDENFNRGDELKAYLNKSFAAYRASVRGDQDWVDSRIGAVVSSYNSMQTSKGIGAWEDRVAASAGIPVGIVSALGESLVNEPSKFDFTMHDWFLWMWRWFTERPDVFVSLVRQEGLEGLFGKEYIDLADPLDRGAFAIPTLQKLLELWMGGFTLLELEKVFGTKEHLLRKCENAREFVLRIVPELSYIFGLPALIQQAIWAEDDKDTIDLPLTLKMLGSCVKEGFDTVDKIILRHIRKSEASRVEIHEEYESILPFLGESSLFESYSEARIRIKKAIDAFENF